MFSYIGVLSFLLVFLMGTDSIAAYLCQSVFAEKKIELFLGENSKATLEISGYDLNQVLLKTQEQIGGKFFGEKIVKFSYNRRPDVYFDRAEHVNGQRGFHFNMYTEAGKTLTGQFRPNPSLLIIGNHSFKVKGMADALTLLHRFWAGKEVIIDSLTQLTDSSLGTLYIERGHRSLELTTDSLSPEQLNEFTDLYYTLMDSKDRK